METLTFDNYKLDQTMTKTMPDGEVIVFKAHNLTPYYDQARGSGYTNGKVIIDAQAFGNGDELPMWDECFITYPEEEILTATAGTAAFAITGGLIPNTLTAPKNNAIVDSIKIEQGGVVLENDTQNSAHFANFKKHCMTSVDDLAKNQDADLYYPDSVGAWSAAASLQGIANNANANASTATSYTYTERANTGLVKRQQMGFPLNAHSADVLNTASNQKEELATYQEITSAITSIATTGTTLSHTHRLRVIKPALYSDFIAKHPMCPGTGYKFTFTVNQGTCVSSYTVSGSTQFSTLPTLTKTTPIGPSTCMPTMLCLGPGTAAGSLTTTAGTTDTLTLTLTSQLDTSGNTRQTGVILWVPSIVPTNEIKAKLQQTPKIIRRPYKITSSVFTGLAANASINQQLFSAIANPRLLVIIPQFSQTTQTQASQMSPFNPSPGCSDPTLSLTKNQIRLNNKQVLQAPQSYNFQHFRENLSKILAFNGGVGPLTSGIIDLQKWLNNYRYYAYDLSVLDDSQRDVPQLISFESYNNNKVAIDLYCFVLGEVDTEFDMIKGGVSMS